MNAQRTLAVIVKRPGDDLEAAKRHYWAVRDRERPDDNDVLYIVLERAPQLGWNQRPC